MYVSEASSQDSSTFSRFGRSRSASSSMHGRKTGTKCTAALVVLVPWKQRIHSLEGGECQIGVLFNIVTSLLRTKGY